MKSFCMHDPFSYLIIVLHMFACRYDCLTVMWFLYVWCYRYTCLALTKFYTYTIFGNAWVCIDIIEFTNCDLLLLMEVNIMYLLLDESKNHLLGHMF